MSTICCDVCGGPYTPGRMLLIYAAKPVKREDGTAWPPGHTMNHCREWPIVCSKDCVRRLGPEWGPPGWMGEAMEEELDEGLASGKLTYHYGRVVRTGDWEKLPEKPAA